MNGRILTERLLATSSLAALLLATAGTQDASAVSCTFVPAGSIYSNSSSIPCVVVTTNAISITNTATGTIGNSNSNAAVAINGGATLSGAVINAGTITTSGPGSGLVAILDNGIILGGITNSGTVTLSAGQGNCNGAIRIGGTSFFGGIGNSGTIAASLSGAPTGGCVQALTIRPPLFTGNVTNSGMINAAAVATAATDTVTAIGVNTQVSTLTGSILNSGTIAASVQSNARANATGLLVSTNLMIGSLSNGGTITATGISSGSSALAVGVSFNAATLIGGVTNSGTIAATATATSDTASAYGITLTGTIFTGSFSNGGTITATAISSAAGASASGVSINVRTLIGGITNSGTIAATATAADHAFAVGLTTYENNNGSTQLLGGFLNTGTISAIATGTNSGATADGVRLGGFSSGPDSELFAGGVSNGGTIIATASGTGALATGLDVSIQAYHATASSTFASLSGGVTNSGTIITTATGTTGSVKAIGVNLNVYASNSSTNSIAFGILSGNVVNTGRIIAIATSTDGGNVTASGLTVYAGVMNGDFVNNGTIAAAASAIHGVATAFGAQLTIYSAIGNFGNTGTIAATATASTGNASATGLSLLNYNGMIGGFSNGGTISGTATVTDGLAFAEGAGIALSVYSGTGVTGDFVNSGTISASGTATSTSSSASVGATGLSLGIPGAMFGGVTNSGIISAAAVQIGVANSGCASAIAMTFYASTMFGNFSNSGTIAASAIGGGSSASARGLSLSFGTMLGAIVNSGTISAMASAPNGNACASGLSVSFTSIAAVSNSGTITASASGKFGCARAVNIFGTTFAGNFTNSGTIAASFAAVSGGSGTATAVRLSVTSFAGTLANSGTISATRSGTGLATAINVDELDVGSLTIANSGTIAATDLAINLTHSGVQVTINQSAGLITGTTAIAFSSNNDILNASGGKISGALIGPTSGTMPTINVVAGAGGTFTFAGTTTNIGTIKVNSGTLLLATQANGAGSVVNTANFTQAAGGTLGMTVSPTVHPSINATNLTLGGPLVVYETVAAWQPGTTYSYTNSLTWTSLTGAFTSVNSNSPLFTAGVTQVGSSDTITLGLLSPSQIPGISPNNRGVLLAAETDGLTPIYSLTNIGQLNTLLTSLSGEQNTQTFQFNVNAWNQFTSMLIDRLFGGGGSGPTGVASFNKGQGLQFAQADIPQVAQASDAARPGVAPAPMKTSPWGVWARGYGSWASAPSTASSASYDESGAGVILGGDAQIGDRAVAGFAFNIGTDNVDVSGGAHNDIKTYQGAFYGKYDVDPHIYVAGLAGFGWQDYDARRFIMAPFNAAATSNYSGQGFRLYGESGYAIHLASPMPDTSVTPYLGLGYLHTHVDGFTESGGGGAGLSVGAVDANSFATTLGARASTSLRVGNTALRPELRVAWQHEWLDDSTNVRSAFAAAPGSVFTVTGAGFGRDSFIGGAGVSTTLAGFGVSDPRLAPTELFVDYDVRVNGGYLANVVSGGFRAKF